MKSVIAILSVFIFIGCEKEEMTNHTATWVNNSTHTIQIKPFIAGSLQLDKVVNLSPNSSKLIGQGHMKGINEVGSGFFSDYVNNSDSIQVIFDNQFRITHYVQTPPDFSPKYYLYTSEKNLLNINSYSGEITSDSKRKRTIEYKYIFTDVHFNDAQ